MASSSNKEKSFAQDAITENEEFQVKATQSGFVMSAEWDLSRSLFTLESDIRASLRSFFKAA